MLAAALALTVSLFLGTSDFIAGVKSRRFSVLGVLAFSQVVGLLLLIPLVVAVQQDPPAARYLGYAALAGVSGCIGTASLYRGLAVGKMSVVAPISASAAIVPIFFGVAGGERPAAGQAIGIAVALIGVVVTARVPDEGPSATRGVATGAGFALLAALGGGFFLTLMNSASEGNVLWAATVARLTLLALLVCSALTLRRAIALRPDAGLLSIGLLETASWILFGVATTLGLLSVVGILASLYPVVTVLLARIVLHERVATNQRVGIGLVMTGLVLIAGEWRF
jgi:drug/metabolite transporter (DMT)-like permease